MYILNLYLHIPKIDMTHNGSNDKLISLFNNLTSKVN